MLSQNAILAKVYKFYPTDLFSKMITSDFDQFWHNVDHNFSLLWVCIQIALANKHDYFVLA